MKRAMTNQSGKTALKRKLVDLRKRLSEFISGSQLEFVMSQLRGATRKAKGVRSQGAKWVYLTWDAVKGLLVSFCSVASTYHILTAQPENYVAGKKLLPFSHFPQLL